MLRLNRLWSPLRREEGMALPLSLLVVATIGVLVTSSLDYSRSSGRTANVAKGRIGAEALAEAGIANALAVLNYWDDTSQKNNAGDPTLLGCNSAGTTCTPFVSTFSEGTAKWYGTLNTTTMLWSITSTGSVANPTGGPALAKTLKATAVVTWNNTQPSNASAWNYVFSTAPPGTGCEVDINGDDVRISTPFYIRGDLCLTGKDARFEEKDLTNPPSQPMDLRVGGRIVYNGQNGKIGHDQNKPLTSGAVVGGCAATITGVAHTCSPANGDRYWVQNNAAFQSLAFPTSDFATYYQSARPGPKAPCATAANPTNLAASKLDSDLVMNGTTPLFDLTPGSSSYQCKVYDGAGNLVGELSWDKDQKLLTVRGVIFIDGSVTSTSDHADYTGSATLYVNGIFSLAGANDELCGNFNKKDCKFDSWDPNQNMLLIVAGSTGNAIQLTGKKVNFQGGLFCNPTSTILFTGDDVDVQGPVICGKFTFGKKAEFKSLPVIKDLPIGAPLNPNVHATPAKPVYGG